MGSYRSSVIEAISAIVDLDEFDDSVQNKDLYGDGSLQILRDFYIRNRLEGDILDVGCGTGDLSEILPGITHGVDPNLKRLKVASERSKFIVVSGWVENLPFGDSVFETVVCWGTLCFVRSLMESLYEINRVLRIGGMFIFDVAEQTSLPIIQTVHLDSFVEFVKLFGFSLVERREMEYSFSFKRGLLAVKKFEDFNPRRFLLPQCVGKINNFLPERDWYMR